MRRKKHDVRTKEGAQDRFGSAVYGEMTRSLVVLRIPGVVGGGIVLAASDKASVVAVLMVALVLVLHVGGS